MASPAQIANYYDGYPDPDNPRTWGLHPSGVRIRNFATAQANWEAAHGASPKPDAVPPPAPSGAGVAAARAGDATAHGGTIGPVTTGHSAKVFIGYMAAACQGDPHICPMFTGVKPHGGGTITKGSSTVLIGGKPAARVSDLTVCTSEPGQVAVGEMTVLIGDLPAVGGAGSGAADDRTSEDDGSNTAGETPPEQSAGGEGKSSRRRQAKVKAADRQPGPSVQDTGKGVHWISIELVDEADQPVAAEQYRITLPDGQEIGGALDATGQARINGVQVPGWCRITFPRLDLQAWQKFSGTSSTAAGPTHSSPLKRRADAVVRPGPNRAEGTWRTAACDDCVSSIAFNAGHFWHTIWEHEVNGALRAARGNPNVLREGDAVFVPEIRPRIESGSTDQHHRFVRRGEPAHLLVRVLDDAEPLANSPWTIDIVGRRLEGTTDQDGNLSIPMIANARVAVLRVGPPVNEMEYDLELGGMDPINSNSGVVARFQNLGLLSSGDYKSEVDLEDALREYQARHGLAVTGKSDDATRARLLQEHGS